LKHSILVVDDEESIRTTCVRTLEKSGYQVLAIESGEQALNILSQTHYDLVVSDLCMNGISGIELIEEAKKINPDTMFIIFTGHSSISSAIDALRLGASDYLLKPYNKQDLLFRVDNCLSKLRLKKQLKNKSLELERSNQELKNFAAIVSHDLKAPLRKVMNYSERIKKICVDLLDDQGKNYFDRLQNATFRMHKFINDLLTYSEVRHKPLKFEPTDLNFVIAQVIEDLEEHISYNQGTINFQKLPTLEAQSFQIKQLFQNLISNALKFHADKKPPVIEIQSRLLDGGNHEISIADNGIGMDLKFINRIFEPFEVLHGSSQNEGHGLGLAICKTIVDFHHGTIDVKSVVGQGTTFIISLPEKQPTQN
jgi:signal transduction histidine kinase